MPFLSGSRDEDISEADHESLRRLLEPCQRTRQPVQESTEADDDVDDNVQDADADEEEQVVHAAGNDTTASTAQPIPNPGSHNLRERGLIDGITHHPNCRIVVQESPQAPWR